ncbi:MAG: hypothetical protein ACR2G5_04205 [Pyrinomonadaceae bacterium]
MSACECIERVNSRNAEDPDVESLPLLNISLTFGSSENAFEDIGKRIYDEKSLCPCTYARAVAIVVHRSRWLQQQWRLVSLAG